jgi:hypothetical protein
MTGEQDDDTVRAQLVRDLGARLGPLDVTPEVAARVRRAARTELLAARYPPLSGRLARWWRGCELVAGVALASAYLAWAVQAALLIHRAPLPEPGPAAHVILTTPSRDVRFSPPG